MYLRVVIKEGVGEEIGGTLPRTMAMGATLRGSAEVSDDVFVVPVESLQQQILDGRLDGEARRSGRSAVWQIVLGQHNGLGVEFFPPRNKVIYSSQTRATWIIKSYLFSTLVCGKQTEQHFLG